MVKIELEGRGFVGALLSLNQKSDYSTNIFEILYFAITYGYKSLRRANFAEMARRLITVYGALEKKKTPHDYKYVKKSCYINSNSNEKAYISYVLGMTLCKFVAKKTLGFDMLLHYDMLANTHGFSISRNLLSNERPDFIGFDKKNKQYLVIEAKGRSGSFDSRANAEGKNQTGTILSINRQNPLRVVTQSYFDPELNVVYEDPEQTEGIHIKFDFDLDSLYIDCIRNIFKSEEKSLKSYKIDDVNFVGQEISGTPYFVGIFREVLDSGNNHLSSILKTVEKMKEKNSDEQLYIGDEGIILMDKEVLQKYSC